MKILKTYFTLNFFLMSLILVDSNTFAAGITGKWVGPVALKSDDGITVVCDSVVRLSIKNDRIWFQEVLSGYCSYEIYFEFDKKGSDVYSVGHKVGTVSDTALILTNAVDSKTGEIHSISVSRLFNAGEKIFYEIKTQFMDVISNESGILTTFENSKSNYYP